MQDEQITQSRFSVKTIFAFDATRVTYSLRDTSGERSFSVPYEILGVRNKSTVTFNNNNFAWRLRLIPIVTFFLGFGIGEADYETAAGAIEAVSIVAFIALLACGFFKVFAIRYTLVPLIPSPPEAQGHPLRVMQGRYHQEILDHLERRWKERLKTLYGKADLSRERSAEMARLNWLKENAVLSAEEFELESAKLAGQNLH